MVTYGKICNNIYIIMIVMIMISESLPYQCIFFYNVIGLFYLGKYGILL